MIIRKISRVVSWFLLGLGLSFLIGTASYAQDAGLGYSEAPFALINNATETIGDTPLEAIQAAVPNSKIQTFWDGSRRLSVISQWRVKKYCYEWVCSVSTGPA